MPFKVDVNQTQIVNEFRKRGAKVDITARVGNGFPDLVVNHAGIFSIVEVKTENGKLRSVQRRWFEDRSGLRFIARDTDDVMAILDVMSKVSKAAKEILDDYCN